jgi:hypothetical protein
MENAIRLRVTVGEDHKIQLPSDVPTGDAEVIVLFPTRAPAEDDRAARAEARRRMFGSMRGRATIAEDFDAPLPDDILADFEGGSEP